MKTKDYIYYINIYHLTDPKFDWSLSALSHDSAVSKDATCHEQPAVGQSNIIGLYTLITHIWYSCQCYLPINIYRLIGGDWYVFSAHLRII